MSDTHAVPEAQEGSVTPAEGVNPEQATPEVHPQPDTTSADAPDGEKPSRAGERIKGLAAERDAALEYGEFWRKRYEEANQPKPSAPAEDPRPKLADFDGDTEQWADALTAWTERRAAHKAEEAAEARLKKAREEERLRNLQGAYFQRAADFSKQHPDYETAISNPALTFMNGQFLETLMDSEKGPQIAYHIAKSPELVAKLARQSVPQRLATLGRIEAELSRPPPPPKQSAAPPPPNPIGAASGAGEKDPSKMTADEWLVWRTAQLRANRAQRT